MNLKKTVLIVLLISHSIFAMQISLANNSYFDNSNYFINNSNFNIDFNTKLGGFGLEYQYLNFNLSDTLLTKEEIKSGYNNLNISYKNSFKYLDINLKSNLVNLSNLYFGSNLNFKFTKTFSIALHYNSDLVRDTPLSIKNMINYNSFGGDLKYKSGSIEFGGGTNYKMISGVDSDTLIKISNIGSIQPNNVFSTYGYFLKSFTKDRDIIVGLSASYANADNSTNLFIYDYNNSKEAFYPYYAPINEFSTSLLLMKIFAIKNRLWIIPKFTIPLYSFSETNYSNLDNYDNSLIEGTHQFEFQTNISFLLTNHIIISGEYKYFQKPYSSYRYFDFNNSYIANNININLTYKF